MDRQPITNGYRMTERKNGHQRSSSATVITLTGGINDDDYQRYVTITSSLTKELENLSRQLKTISSRIHHVNEELIQIRRELKYKNDDGL